MQCRIASTDSAALAITGCLDFGNAAAILAEGKRLIDSAPPHSIDLAELADADSAGLACVLALLGAARARVPECRVVHAPRGLRALAEVCDATEWIGA